MDIFTINLHFENILNSLKLVYNYEKMSEARRRDFDDEINALFPQDYATILEPYSSFYAIWWRVNIKEVKPFRDCFGDTWPLFLFLHVNLTFTNESLYSREHEIDLLSYNPSHEMESNSAFWHLFFCIKSFLLLSYVSERVKKQKLCGFLQKILSSLTDLNILSKKLVEREIRDSILTFESLYFYVHNFPVKTNKSFNYENRISYSPQKIISFTETIEVKQLVNVGKHQLTKIVEEQVEVYYVYVATHMRMERYTSANFYGYAPFKFKTEVQESVLNLPLYPDIKFMEYLRKELYPDLSVEYCNEIVAGLKKKLDESFNEKYWTFEIQNKRSDLQREYSSALENLKKIKFLTNEWESELHFTTAHDWRGRKRYTSPIGFTSFKMARLCFHYGEGGVIGPEWEDWTTYKPIIDKLKARYGMGEGGEIIGYLLMAIGKFDESRRRKTSVTCYDMMERGLSFFDGESPRIDDPDDYGSFLQLKFTLHEFLNGSKVKRMISKDATASGYMLEVCLMYPQSKKIDTPLLLTNLLDDSRFIDTYQGITDLVKKGCVIPNEITYLLTRKIMKPFYMIIPYSAGFEKCFSKIIPYIKTDNHQSVKNINEIADHFKIIWKFVSQAMWIELGFRESFKDYIKNKKEDILESETAVADLRYFHMDKTRLDVKKFTRTTRTILSPSAYINNQETDKSRPPNTIAFYESEILRIMAENPWNINIITVHDAFFPSIYDCGKVVRCYGSFFYIKMGLTGKPPRTTLL